MDTRKMSEKKQNIKSSSSAIKKKAGIDIFLFFTFGILIPAFVFSYVLLAPKQDNQMRTAQACGQPTPCPNCDGCPKWMEGCLDYLLQELDEALEDAIADLPNDIAEMFVDELNDSLGLSPSEEDDIENSLTSVLQNVGNDLFGYDVFTNEPDKNSGYVPPSPFDWDIDIDLGSFDIEIDPLNLGKTESDAIFDLGVGNFDTDWSHGSVSTVWNIPLSGGNVQIGSNFDFSFSSDSFDAEFDDCYIKFTISF